MMRAQITIEYLLLSVIALVLISFSVFALGRIKDASEKAYDAVEFRSSAADLANAMDEVCALGEGNSRVVYLRRAIDAEGGLAADGGRYAEMRDSASNLTIVREAFCDIAGAVGLEGKTEVKNEGGEIFLSKS